MPPLCGFWSVLSACRAVEPRFVYRFCKSREPKPQPSHAVRYLHLYLCLLGTPVFMPVRGCFGGGDCSLEDSHH